MKPTSSRLILIVVWLINVGLVSECGLKKPESARIKVPEKFDHLLLSEVVDSIRYVPLETRADCLIGSVTKLLCVENRIYILDRDISKTLFVFDDTGKFLFRLGRKGKGPGEFTRPNDFLLDPAGRKIIVLDQNLSKLSFFDFDGTFLRDLRLGFAPFFIAGVNENTYACYLGYLPFREQNQIIKSNLVLIDTLGIVKGKFFFYETGKDPLRYYPQTTFYSSPAGTVFIPPLENSVYLVTSSGVSLSYTIDLGIESLPNDYIRSMKPQHELVDGLRAYRHSVYNFFETSSWIYFSFFDKKEVASCFYSKVSGEAKAASAIADNIDGGYFAMPTGRWGEELVGVLESVYLTKLKQEEADKKILKRGQKLEKILEGIDDVSNPLLVFYRLKEF